jgi:hypothetical protein
MVYLSTGGSKKFNAGPFEFGYATGPDGVVWTKVGPAPSIASTVTPEATALNNSNRRGRYDRAG